MLFRGSIERGGLLQGHSAGDVYQRFSSIPRSEKKAFFKERTVKEQQYILSSLITNKKARDLFLITSFLPPEERQQVFSSIRDSALKGEIFEDVWENMDRMPEDFLYFFKDSSPQELIEIFESLKEHTIEELERNEKKAQQLLSADSTILSEKKKIFEIFLGVQNQEFTIPLMHERLSNLSLNDVKITLHFVRDRDIRIYYQSLPENEQRTFLPLLSDKSLQHLVEALGPQSKSKLLLELLPEDRRNLFSKELKKAHFIKQRYSKIPQKYSVNFLWIWKTPEYQSIYVFPPLVGDKNKKNTMDCLKEWAHLNEHVNVWYDSHFVTNEMIHATEDYFKNYIPNIKLRD